ncbi:MAG: TRAP transporter small permease [Desulfobacterales bacterium]|nr:TRAP transporter small permease [Desulfobacterales bacterium]
MKAAFKALLGVSRWLNAIGAITLTFMMLLTVADIFLRIVSRPILGTYEIVSILLAVVIGFSIPQVSLDKGHVYMEFLIGRLAGRKMAALFTFTRILCIMLFLFIGYNLFSVANEFRLSGEVTPTIQLPFYPVAYGVGVCCFIECFVFAFDILKIWKKRYE